MCQKFPFLPTEMESGGRGTGAEIGQETFHHTHTHSMCIASATAPILYYAPPAFRSPPLLGRRICVKVNECRRAMNSSIYANIADH